MRVILDFQQSSLFGADWLCELVGIARRFGHQITTSPAWPGSKHLIMANTKNQPRLRERLIQVVETGTASIDSEYDLGLERPRVRIRVGQIADWGKLCSRVVTLPPNDETLRYLENPLRILLENDRSDWLFLQWTTPESWKSRFQGAIASHRIEPDNAGGIGNLKAKVEGRAASDPVFRLRTMAFMDSDRPCPGDPMGQAYQTQRTCESSGIPFHMLFRRMAENYVPERLLSEWASTDERRVWLTAWCALSADQKHFYKLKQGGGEGEGGFRNHTHKQHDGVRELYGAMIDDEDGPLWRGPPGDLARIWIMKHEEEMAEKLEIPIVFFPVTT